MRLGLGTVQFGLNYGISNRNGKTGSEEVACILRLAREKGIKLLDTAPLYGNSEEVLGSHKEMQNFVVVTKTPQFGGTVITASDVEILVTTLLKSLTRLGLHQLYGLLVHNADDIQKPNGHLLMEALADSKRQGLVQKIGVSVYNREQIDAIVEKYAIDLIQVPINILDQRLLVGGYLSSLKRAGLEIHARSAFLQGVLLMPPSSLPLHFQKILPLMEKYHELLAAKQITPLRAAIKFITQHKEIDYLITGVTSASELSEIYDAFRSTDDIDIDFTGFACPVESIVNPSLWVK
jgi:aryl-alcohol dehydrogenase-like predicted oxidoreductase